MDSTKLSNQLQLIDESLNETCEIEIDPNGLDVSITPKEVSMPAFKGNVNGRRSSMDFKNKRSRKKSPHD